MVVWCSLSQPDHKSLVQAPPSHAASTFEEALQHGLSSTAARLLQFVGDVRGAKNPLGSNAMLRLLYLIIFVYPFIIVYLSFRTNFWPQFRLVRTRRRVVEENTMSACRLAKADLCENTLILCNCGPIGRATLCALVKRKNIACPKMS